MRPLDYKSPGPEDGRERLAQWENWILLVSLPLLLGGIVAIWICFGALTR